MLKINGTKIRDPSGLTWGLQDISSENAGRTQDTLMHKDRLGQKRKLECVWNNISPSETAKILQAINSDVYMKVTYHDAMSNKEETRIFYVGDRSAPVKSWTVGYRRYSQLSFNFIER